MTNQPFFGWALENADYWLPDQRRRRPRLPDACTHRRAEGAEPKRLRVLNQLRKDTHWENVNLRESCEDDTVALVLMTKNTKSPHFRDALPVLISRLLLKFDLCRVQFRGAAMFNIVKRRDLMLANDTSTLQEAEQLLLTNYGRDYIVVNRADAEPIEELQTSTVAPAH